MSTNDSPRGGNYIIIQGSECKQIIVPLLTTKLKHCPEIGVFQNVWTFRLTPRTHFKGDQP